MARFLRIQIGIRHYVTRQSFTIDKCESYLLFYLSKFKKQIPFFDLVRSPTSDYDPEFVKRKVICNICAELRAFGETQYDIKFLDGDDLNEYRARVAEQIVKIKSSKRKRFIKELGRVIFFVNEQAQEIRSFLEILPQGLSIKDQYFVRMIISKSIIQVLILNNVEFAEYLSQKYRDTIYVINITKES